MTVTSPAAAVGSAGAARVRVTPNLFIGAVATRSVSALARGTFLPREPVPPAVRGAAVVDR